MTAAERVSTHRLVFGLLWRWQPWPELRTFFREEQLGWLSRSAWGWQMSRATQAECIDFLSNDRFERVRGRSIDRVVADSDPFRRLDDCLNCVRTAGDLVEPILLALAAELPQLPKQPVRRR